MIIEVRRTVKLIPMKVIQAKISEDKGKFRVDGD